MEDFHFIVLHSFHGMCNIRIHFWR